jgi:hypothetical protein
MSNDRLDERRRELLDALMALNVALEIEFSMDLDKARSIVRAELDKMGAWA